MRRARETYPRINCLVAGCKRGTTRVSPHEDGSAPNYVCSPHWRTVPKSWRTAVSFLRRRYFSAERKGDEQDMARVARIYWQSWARIVTLLKEPETVMDGELPATLATGLRAQGLL